MIYSLIFPLSQRSSSFDGRSVEGENERNRHLSDFHCHEIGFLSTEFSAWRTIKNLKKSYWRWLTYHLLKCSVSQSQETLQCDDCPSSQVPASHGSRYLAQESVTKTTKNIQVTFSDLVMHRSEIKTSAPSWRCRTSDVIVWPGERWMSPLWRLRQWGFLIVTINWPLITSNQVSIWRVF